MLFCSSIRNILRSRNYLVRENYLLRKPEDFLGGAAGALATKVLFTANFR